MAIDATKLSAILQDFVSSTSDVQGAALVTPDGLSLSSVLPSGMDEERVAAMSAAMLSLGERIGSELVRGSIQQIYVEGEKGYGVLTGCGDDSVFLVLANHTAKQGLLMLEIRRAIGQIKPILT